MSRKPYPASASPAPSSSSSMREQFLAKAGHQELGRTKIAELNLVMKTATVIGIVFKRRDKHSFQDKRDPARTREVFSFYVRDESGDIQVSCWDDASLMYDLVDVGNVVVVENAAVRQPSSNSGSSAYGSTPQLELSLDGKSTSRITPYTGRDLHFDLKRPPPTALTPINDLINHQNQSVDILGIVDRIMLPETFISKAGKELRKQVIHISDRTASGLAVTFWTDLQQLEYLVENQSIVLLHLVKVNSYNDTPRVSFGFDSAMTVDPKMEEAEALYQFSVGSPRAPSIAPASGGGGGGSRKKIQADEITDYYPVSRILATQLSPDTPVYGYTLGSLHGMDMRADASCCYQNCGNCRKRVAGDTCPVCGSLSTDMFRLQLKLIDHTGTLDRVTLFSEAAEALLGYKFEEFKAMSPVERAQLEESFAYRRVKLSFRLGIENVKWPKLSVLYCTPIEWDEATQAVSRSLGGFQGDLM